MIWKCDKRVKGVFQLLKLAGSLVAIISLASGCASESAANESNNQGQYSISIDCHATQTVTDRDACATVQHLLQQALTAQVQLSDEDIQKLQPDPDKTNAVDLNEVIENCNDDDYEDSYSGSLWETAETVCDSLGTTIWPEAGFSSTDPGLGANNPAAETAFARACALPIIDGVRVVANGCASLSLLFQARHQPELALAVTEYAPKCHGKPHAQPEIHPIDYIEDSANSQLESCLWQKSDVLRSMGRPKAATAVYKTLCDAAVEAACSDFADMGGQVNLKSVEERQASLQAAAQSRADADSAARAQARAEQNADEQNLINALHSLPGGSDPNAIIDSTNQQAASIDTLGAAHDAALQRGSRNNIQGVRQQAPQGQVKSAMISDSGNAGDANSTTTSSSAAQGSSASPSGTSTYTYSKPAMDCLCYAADQRANSILVTNNCQDSVVLTWARPAGTHVGLDDAIQGGADVVTAGGTDLIPPKPVRVFACHWPGDPTKPGYENASGDEGMLEYTDTAFVCPSGNQSTKKPE